ncbi:limb region 1 protein homolog [Varroa jacobsoni]|uniref:Protein LMBR1L n=1 Tax=Varroa destructor TaxID=109461 RepID=A0A7M7M2W2_VARDE|nr:limb region 1 protein homolog [Varroa destructor]XP_022689294.1 limb region 1 protein homolog [Varroa jacobsoni]
MSSETCTEGGPTVACLSGDSGGVAGFSSASMVMTRTAAILMDEQEKQFHNAVREYTLGLLFFLLLYMICYYIIDCFRKKKESYYENDAQDAIVYKISLYMCSFSLATSTGAALLLPLSIISNEVKLLCPTSYYWEWLNSSLIQGLWNAIFLCSNISLFGLLPFAYLFTESEGLPGSRRGILPRVYESGLVLMLVITTIVGMLCVLSMVIDSSYSLEYMFTSGFLPFLYSIVSFFGCLLLLICTPLGFARLFTVISEWITKPAFLQDLDEDYYVAVQEEQCLRHKMDVLPKNVAMVHIPTEDLNALAERHSQAIKRLIELEHQRKRSALRTLLYPIAMALLLVFTIYSFLLVVRNILELLFGVKTLPIVMQDREPALGIASLSSLGTVGCALEILLILYLWGASLVGFYSNMTGLRPRRNSCPLTAVILNCAVFAILSSALPLLSRVVGLTDFDLLGNFGRVRWLGNFTIVLGYNLLFAGFTLTCLLTKFTAATRRELINRMRVLVAPVTRFKLSMISGYLFARCPKMFW